VESPRSPSPVPVVQAPVVPHAAQRREREERVRSPEPVAKEVVSQVVKAREEKVSRARKGLKVHHCDLCPKV
jgi:hypothetical protein